jgi:hypothetical protein
VVVAEIGAVGLLVDTMQNIEAFVLPFSLAARSKVYRTSSAVSSRPLTGGFAWKRTPLRSLKTYDVSPVCCQDSARSPSIRNAPGRTPGPALCRRSRLCVKLSTTCVV